LSRISEITTQNEEGDASKKLNWRNTWETLKKMQGKKCISLKKSKALMFRIKCMNDILPTKDMCYLRNPKLYKSRRCIACLRADETLYHIAECELYQKIWANIEEELLI
jgi:hypothetical protein